MSRKSRRSRQLSQAAAAAAAAATSSRPPHGQGNPRRTNINDRGSAAKQRNNEIVRLGKEHNAQAILTLFEEQKEHFNGVNWATAMSQLGRMQNLSPRNPRLLAFFESLADCVEEKGLHWLGVRSISNIVHAIAKKNLKSPGVGKILNFIERKEHTMIIVREGTTQAIANTVWACAVLEYRSPNLCAAIDKFADWLVSQGTPQAVANTIWACATLDYNAPNLFAKITDKSNATWLVRNGDPQHVANMAWAFAKSSFKAWNLLEEIDKNAVRLVRDGTPQNAANTVWACATLGFKASNLLAEIDKNAVRLVRDGTPQNAANTVWACATLGFKASNLFAEIDKNAAWLVSEGNTQDVANTAWAFATLGFKPLNLFAMIEDRVARLVSEGVPQDICSCCYAFACLDHGKDYNEALSQLWSRAMQLDPELLMDEGVTQLAQVFAFCQADGIKLSQPTKAMARRWRSVSVNSVSSQYQDEVSHFLTELAVKHEVEASPLRGCDLDNGLLAIDLACIAQEIAIEYDGPSHFLYELPTGKLTRCENGATQAKRRFLERLGWTVVNIDYRDWMEAKKNKSELKFLQGTLREARFGL